MAMTSDTFTLAITAPIPPLKITSANALPPAVEGVAYSFTFAASGGVPPYVWSSPDLATASAGSLTLSSAGVLSGTPTLTGTVVFQAQVTDAQP